MPEHRSDADQSGFSSGESNDENESSAPRTLVGTKRKTSYSMQRQEIAVLKEQADVLERERKRLDAKRPMAMALERLRLESAVRSSRLFVAGAQSLLSRLKDEQPPIGSYIHLPREPADRQRILHAIKRRQIDDAAAYMFALCAYADLKRPMRQTSLTVAANGDSIAELWEITLVAEPTATVRRVFEEMRAFARVREMALADRSGALEVRESDLESDPSDAAQSRILSTHRNGLLVEKNAVAHSQYLARSARLSAPYAVYVIDHVDRDDAFPYNPLERVRQDGVSVRLVIEVPEAGGTVAVVKYSFVRARKSALATEDELTEIAEDGLRACSDVMMKVVRERLQRHQQ